MAVGLSARGRLRQPGIDPWEIEQAHRRLKAEAQRSLQSRMQAALDARDERARAVGQIDVLVLLPNGRVGRLLNRGHGLLPAQWRDSPRQIGWRTGTAERCGDWVRFTAPDGWSATGLIVDRA